MKNGNKKEEILIKYLECLAVVIAVAILQFDINPILKTVISLSLVIYSLVNDVKKAMFVLLLIMPVATEIKFFGDISLTVSIAFLNSVKYCLLGKNLSHQGGHKKKWGIVALILLLYSIIAYAIVGTNEQLVYTIKLLAYLIFIEKFLTDCKEKYKMRGGLVFSSILRVLGAGIVVAFLCILLSGGQLNSAARFSFGELATANNTGVQSSFVVIGIILSCLLKNRRKIDYIIALSCCIVSIATQSRAAILMLGIAIVMYIISAILRGHLLQAILVASLMATSFIALLQVPAINSYYGSINDRFQAEDISNGRYEIWNKTISQMSNNGTFLLMGAGDYYNLDFTFGKKDEAIVAHNFLIETWVIYGVAGVLLLIALLWLYVKETVFTNIPPDVYITKSLFIFAPILALFFGLSFSHHFIGRANIILFISSFIPIACVRQKIRTKVVDNNEK